MAEPKTRKRRREQPWMMTAPLPFTVLEPDEPPTIPCPAKMPSSARRVASFGWSWSPANDRMEDYYITSNVERTHWIVWFCYQDPMGDKQERRPQAYCPKKGLSDEAAAMFLLFMLFQHERETFGDPGPWHDARPDLLSSEQLSALVAMIWSRPQGAKPASQPADPAGDQRPGKE